MADDRIFSWTTTERMVDMEKIESGVVDVMVDLSRVKETLGLVVSAWHGEAGITGQMASAAALVGDELDRISVILDEVYAQIQQEKAAC